MTNKEREQLRQRGIKRLMEWRADWCKFAREALGVKLDPQQEAILRSVQFNARTSVSSGTARGKDFVTAVAAICFMYLTPRWDAKGDLIANTKVALTAPTGRQVTNIMKPEFARLFKKAHSLGVDLPGRLVAADIRTNYDEWYLTAFKADEHQHEAWSGFHAVNTMFAVTEATGISDDTFGAIEGNLQGNSRILIVFNPNVTVGYAAKSQKGDRWNKFRLNSLDAPNVVAGKTLIPGQVDLNWVLDKIEQWCLPISAEEVKDAEDDFEFNGQWYRPEDIFRIKVLGKFPKVSEDSLIPQQWIEKAQERWLIYHGEHGYDKYPVDPLRLGTDVAGMGRDNSVYCYRFGNLVREFLSTNSGGRADHMQIVGRIIAELNANPYSVALIDTIGEGAGVYSRLAEMGLENRAFSTKYSEAPRDEYDNELTDLTGQYKFENKRAYLFWAVRDWLDPRRGSKAMLPPGEKFTEEATEIKYFWKSNGRIMIEPKEEIKARLGRSTDLFDSLANTFDTPQYNEMEDKSYLF